MAKNSTGDFTLHVGGQTIPLTNVAVRLPELPTVDLCPPKPMSAVIDVASWTMASTDPVDHELVELGVLDRLALQPDMTPAELSAARNGAAFDVFVDHLLSSTRMPRR